MQKKVKFPNGDIYDGEWQDNNCHGKGILRYNSGDIYNGEWKDGKKHGQGKYIWDNDDIYEGEWKDGKCNGRGILRFSDSCVYDGEWQDGNFNGKGKFTFANGDIYEGEWKDGKRNGRGTIKYVNGNIYEGEWKDGKCNGWGIFMNVNGDTHEGEWKDDKRHGKGKRTWANVYVYEGEWKDDAVMISSDNAKKENKIPTLVIRSNQIHIEGRLLKYETHKHLPGGKEVKVIVCKNKEKAIKAIRNFSEGIESGDECRIVFDQHGDRSGTNDLKIDKQGAKEIIEYLAEKFKHITISNRSCQGGAAQHFIDVARDLAKNRKVKITIRFAPEDRICIDVLKWKGEQSRSALATIGKDGSRKSREQIEFDTNGICTLTNGDQYEGEWREGKMQGKGTYTYADGSKIIGIWENNINIDSLKPNGNVCNPNHNGVSVKTDSHVIF